MDTIARYEGAGRTLEGDLTITFSINDDPRLIHELSELKDQDVLIEISKLKKKHSDKARKYMWKLCDLMAKALGSDKDTIYIMMLRQAGVFDYFEIPEEAINKLQHIYRYIETVETYTAYTSNADGEEKPITMACIRCFEGMHGYDSKQLSDLINAIVNECSDLRIPTITESEFRRLAGL